MDRSGVGWVAVKCKQCIRTQTQTICTDGFWLYLAGPLGGRLFSFSSSAAATVFDGEDFSAAASFSLLSGDLELWAEAASSFFTGELPASRSHISIDGGEYYI